MFSRPQILVGRDFGILRRMFAPEPLELVFAI
jgi:hypothetical protein